MNKKPCQGDTRSNIAKSMDWPSLRGVSQRSFFFHDNRAKSLSEVLQMHGEVDLSELDVQAKKDLIAFLNSL